MKSLLSLGTAAGLLAAVAAVPVTAQAAPAGPMMMQPAVAAAGNTDVTDVYWRGGGWHGAGWYGGWRGGWRGAYWGGPRYRYWRPGWAAAGVATGLAVGALAARPYYYGGGPYYGTNAYYGGGNCGYVTTRRWVNGHRVWVQRYRCW